MHGFAFFRQAQARLAAGIGLPVERMSNYRGSAHAAYREHINLEDAGIVFNVQPIAGVNLAGRLGLQSVGLNPAEIAGIAALCAVLGHMFPVWLRFRGGKGVATGFGVFLVASPIAALAAIGVFAVVLALSRFVSVASIVAAFSFPIFAWLLVTGSRPPFFFVAGALVSLLIIVKHYPNIRRLMAGTESRIGAHKTA